jgi:activator of HSP90 ATPase
MQPTIEQTVYFEYPARKLYDLYMNPKRHAEFTGGKVKISSKPGSAFTAFDGMLSGQMLLAVPGQLIVQAWRSMKFHKSDPDSILVLQFVQDGKRGRIDLAHVNVPAHDHADVTEGWRKYYWAPLKKYLEKRASKA